MKISTPKKKDNPIRRTQTRGSMTTPCLIQNLLFCTSRDKQLQDIQRSEPGCQVDDCQPVLSVCVCVSGGENVVSEGTYQI